MTRRLLVICNALDDVTRLRRGIATDSPAASRKVFLMCRATRLAGVRPIILSLGRGRQDGSGRYFRTTVCRVGGVPIIYAAFWQRALLSQLLSLLAPVALIWRTRRLDGDKAILFYNCAPAYVPTLLLASLLGFRTVLDLEDGEVAVRSNSFTALTARLTRGLFDRLCSGGALLACQALAQMTTLRPVACYYGTVESGGVAARWPVAGLKVLMGGTVSHDTGASMLIEAIKTLRKLRPAWSRDLSIELTGKGDAMAALIELAGQPGWPTINVHGRTTDSEYRAIASGAQVGLALKPRSGPLAHTTFPSKVIELADAGLLVLTTDISDVRSIFADGAVFLEDESAAGLLERLRWIAENRDTAQAIASLGTQRVRERCEPSLAGRSLAEFLFCSDR